MGSGNFKTPPTPPPPLTEVLPYIVVRKCVPLPQQDVKKISLTWVGFKPMHNLILDHGYSANWATCIKTNDARLEQIMGHLDGSL